MNFFDKIKYRTWKFLYRFFPTIQKIILRIGLIHHDGSKRQFHVAWLAEGKTLDALKNHLKTEWNFGNHFIAWPYDSLVMSWRKLEDFQHQYHIQIFSDGEICGHYEFTPEAHPIEHIEEKGEHEAKADFLKFLGEFAAEVKHISCLECDPNNHIDPEIFFDYKKFLSDINNKINVRL